MCRDWTFRIVKTIKQSLVVGAQVGTFFAEGIALMVNAGADWSKPEGCSIHWVQEYVVYFNKTGIYLGWRTRLGTASVASGGKHNRQTGDWASKPDTLTSFRSTVTIEPAVYYKWRFNDGDNVAFRCEDWIRFLLVISSRLEFIFHYIKPLQDTEVYYFYSL